MANPDVVHALMVANHRHRVRTNLKAEKLRNLQPRKWEPERVACLLDTIVRTVRKLASNTADRNKYAEDHVVRAAWYLARSASRLAQGKHVRLMRLYNVLTFQCLLCHRDAIIHVGMRGYCRKHRSEGEADRLTTANVFDQMQNERVELYTEQQRVIVAAEKNHRARGIKTPKRK